MDTYPSLEEFSMLSWDLEKERNVKVSADTLLDERLADATGLHCPQHDVQKDTSETDDLHVSKKATKNKSTTY